MDDTRLTVPLYTMKAAASYLDMNVSRLRYWANKEDLLTVVPAETAHGPRLPFIALIEAQLYCVFRRNNVPLQAIVSGMRAVRKELGNDMFKEDKLAHDGTTILMNLAKSTTPEWIRAHDLQIAIPRIVDEGLRLITWDDQKYPQSIRLTAYGDSNVVADYRYAFGQPIVYGTRTRVDDIVQLFKAGETLQTICDEFIIDTQTAESVIRAHVAVAA